MRMVYDALDLPYFNHVEPRLSTYVGLLAGYRKNVFAPLASGLQARIVAHWRERGQICTCQETGIARSVVTMISVNREVAMQEKRISGGNKKAPRRLAEELDVVSR